MTNPAGEQQRIKQYLERLRAQLHGFREAEVREIVEELRSHVFEKTASGGESLDSVLAALGSPEELAGQYAADNLLAKVEASRSPLRILESLFRWGSISVAGVFVLLGSLLGYFLGGALVLCALLKAFHPHAAGLWLLPSPAGDPTLSLRLGFSTTPVGGRELLGWWIVPMGLLVGGGLVMLTTRFAIWCVRNYRSSRRFPRGVRG
jgi:hypothetical protein